MKIKIIFSSLFCLFFFCSQISVLAQGEQANPCPDPSLRDCPIDSNIFVLVIGVIVIAAKKAYDYNKNPQSI